MSVKDDILAFCETISNTLTKIEQLEMHPCGATSEYELYVINTRTNLTALTDYCEENL